MGSSAILEMGGKEPERVKDVVMDSVRVLNTTCSGPAHSLWSRHSPMTE